MKPLQPVAKPQPPAPSVKAISDIADSAQIRVVLFINGELVHVPLAAILQFA